MINGLPLIISKLLVNLVRRQRHIVRFRLNTKPEADDGKVGWKCSCTTSNMPSRRGWCLAVCRARTRNGRTGGWIRMCPFRDTPKGSKVSVKRMMKITPECDLAACVCFTSVLDFSLLHTSVQTPDVEDAPPEDWGRDKMGGVPEAHRPTLACLARLARGCIR